MIDEQALLSQFAVMRLCELTGLCIFVIRFRTSSGGHYGIIGFALLFIAGTLLLPDAVLRITQGDPASAAFFFLFSMPEFLQDSWIRMVEWQFSYARWLRPLLQIIVLAGFILIVLALWRLAEARPSESQSEPVV